MTQSRSNPVLEMGASIALTHHEKWDGTGYPQGLSGEEIPLAAGIVAVADVFDAMTSKRPYKAPCTEDQALEVIRERSGNALCPRRLRGIYGRPAGNPFDPKTICRRR